MAKKKKRQLTEQEIRQQEMQELIKLKKMRQAEKEGAALAAEDQLQFEENVVLVPKTFKEKWKNYWYHYKWLTWGGLFLTVLVVWFVRDIFFGPEPDVQMTVCTYSGVHYYVDALDEAFVPYARDYDGDGEIYVSPSESLFATTDGEMQMAYYQKFMAELSGGEMLLCLLDDYTYDLILENTGTSIYIDLEALYPDVDFIEGDKLDVTDLPLGRELHLPTLGISYVEGDGIDLTGYEERRFYICCRYLGNSSKDSEENRLELAHDLDFINNIVAEQYPHYADNAPFYDVDYDIEHRN